MHQAASYMAWRSRMRKFSIGALLVPRKIQNRPSIVAISSGGKDGDFQGHQACPAAGLHGSSQAPVSFVLVRPIQLRRERPQSSRDGGDLNERARAERALSYFIWEGRTQGATTSAWPRVLPSFCGPWRRPLRGKRRPAPLPGRIRQSGVAG